MGGNKGVWGGLRRYLRGSNGCDLRLKLSDQKARKAKSVGWILFGSDLVDLLEALDDQHRNTNMNDKNHLVGQLTMLQCDTFWERSGPWCWKSRKSPACSYEVTNHISLVTESAQQGLECFSL